jgi:hypothetical protein
VSPSELVRFEARVVGEPNSGCWLWAGYCDRSGYGRISVRAADGQRDPSASTHRVSYEHFVGPIPNGLYVLHRCDVPACVNPAHLFVGTHAENMADMRHKSRAYRGRGEKACGAKLTDAQAAEVCALVAGGMTQQAAADHFGVHQTTVSLIVRGKRRVETA